ncbi:TPA: pyruvate kinase, partial [Staphylococcus aureus]|nr:pyruvate kinase [Staphylococcus aureus]
SKYRPKAHIVAITFSEQKARSLSLSWGVYATVADKPSSTDEMFNLASKVSQEEGYASEGDLIIITAGVPVGEKGTTNLMKIQMIGSKLVQGQGVGEEAIIAKAVVAGTAEEAVAKATEGAILVTKTTDKEYMPAIEKASALVVEEGGLTSHAAVVAIAQNIPVIVGAADATSLINNDEV